MLTFRQLDDLPDSVVNIMLQTEMTIIADMARRISSLKGVTAATNWQLMRLEAIGAAQETITRELSAALRMTEQQLVQLFDEAATRTLESDNKLFREAGYDPVPLSENLFLQQLIVAGLEKTQGEFSNLTRTTANTAARQFERALDLAHTQIVTGGMDYQTAVKHAIRSLSEYGLAAITYPSGHTDYLDVATRRAVLTGVNQTAAEVQLANMQQLGSDLVETTAHPGARPTHTVWQGRVFSLSGNSLKYPNFRQSTGYGTGPGLCGWNCRHSFFVFFEGLSEPAYTAEKLREYNSRTVTYNGKEMSLYDATQRQRYIERQIRKWKREAGATEAAGLDSSPAKAKVRQWQTAQRDFINQTGLTRDYFRERAGKQFSTQRIKHGLEDVTREYFEKATPGVGSISYDDGYEKSRHKDEISTAVWLHNAYGGDIVLLAESNDFGVKMPDYRWRGKLWELKTTSTLNATDNQVRKAIKQIQNNPGGVILDYGDIDINLDALVSVITRRIARSAIRSMDVIIRARGESQKVLRHKK